MAALLCAVVDSVATAVAADFDSVATAVVDFVAVAGCASMASLPGNDLRNGISTLDNIRSLLEAGLRSTTKLALCEVTAVAASVEAAQVV